MRREFNQIGRLVKSGLKRSGLEKSVRERDAVTLWPEVVGEKTASVTKVESIRDGTLFVNCRDSAWAQELHFLRPTILAKLNERLGSKVVKEIKLSGVGFSKSQEEEKRQEEEKKPLPELSEEEIVEIEDVATVVENPDMAEKLLRGLKARKALRKSME